jgi:hypothetical protein
MVKALIAHWYASDGQIARSGPHPTQKAAYEAMRLTPAARERQRRETGVDMPYPNGVLVWPEFNDN